MKLHRYTHGRLKDGSMFQILDFQKIILGENGEKDDVKTAV